jgi:hypothetical protein
MNMFLKSAICAAIVSMTAVGAKAANVELPKEATSLDFAIEIASELRAVQLAQMAILDAQVKFFEIVKMSFEGSRGLTNAFDSDLAQTPTDLALGGVTVILDARLAAMWFKGAIPAAGLVREVWAASRGDVGVMRAGAQRVWSSIKVLWGSNKWFSKNFVSTAALGTFAYVQYETYWVINMSEEQYQASIQALDTKIGNLMVQKQEIANQFQPLLAR